MSDPKFPLGVALMDDDHAELEALFEIAAEAPDALIPAFLAQCRDAIAAHFAREEALMQARNVPALHCHVAQHARLIEEIDAALAKGTLAKPEFLRNFTTRDLPNLVMSHVASVDQMAARFLNGTLDPAMVAALRNPESQGS